MIDRRFLDVSLIVQGVANEPAENPTIGTQYIVDEMPTGDFENAEPGQIARYDGENWSFITPKDGNLEVINAETGELMRFDGVLWETVTTLGGGGGSGKSGSSSLLVVEDLAQVISSTNELPDDYILNYCIVDNGLNSPRLIGFDRYSYKGTYEDECYCYNGKYGFFLDVNSVLAGTNGKYYTLKSTFDGESLIEVSEMATGCFVFNKSCNMLYQFNGAGLELVGGNFIGVNYVGISDIARKWSDADYLKHIGETGLYFSGSDSYIVSPDIAYTKWYPSSFVTPKAGDLFASTNHGILYRAVESNSGLSWTPAAFLEKGSVIYNDFDKTTYLYNGTTLEKIKKNEFITVKDVCKFCSVNVSPLTEREASEGDKYLTNEDVKKCWGNEVWCKYSDLAYGNRYLVLSEDYFNFNEPCIYEYVESGQGNMDKLDNSQ